jgi:hypothetical protein
MGFLIKRLLIGFNVLETLSRCRRSKGKLKDVGSILGRRPSLLIISVYKWYLTGLFSEIYLAESGINQQVTLKGRGVEVFRGFCPSPLMWEAL